VTRFENEPNLIEELKIDIILFYNVKK